MNKIKVVVDKRTELMGIMLSLSNYLEKHPYMLNEEANKDYNDRLQKHFVNFKDHKIIKTINYMIENLNFNFDAPYNIILSQFDEKFNLTNEDTNDEYMKIIKSNQGQDFLKNVKDFIEETKFYKFYKSNIEFYNKNIKIEEEDLLKTPIKEYIKNFYGFDNTKKNYYCNLLFVDCSVGGYGLSYNDNPYATMSAQFSNDQKFYPIAKAWLFHELSHPIINPLTAKYLKNEKNIINSEERKILRENAYGSIESIINEYIIRASEVIFYPYCNASRLNIENLIKRNIKKGFIHIQKFVKFLTEYNEKRDEYKTIEDYYPTLLKKAENLFLQSYKESQKQSKN